MVEFKQISLQSSHSSINLKHFVFIMFMLNHDVHLSCSTFIYDLSHYLVSTTCTPIVKHLCITIYIVSTNCTPIVKHLCITISIHCVNELHPDSKTYFGFVLVVREKGLHQIIDLATKKAKCV